MGVTNPLNFLSSGIMERLGSELLKLEKELKSKKNRLKVAMENHTTSTRKLKRRELSEDDPDLKPLSHIEAVRLGGTASYVEYLRDDMEKTYKKYVDTKKEMKRLLLGNIPTPQETLEKEKKTKINHMASSKKTKKKPKKKKKKKKQSKKNRKKTKRVKLFK